MIVDLEVVIIFFVEFVTFLTVVVFKVDVVLFVTDVVVR